MGNGGVGLRSARLRVVPATAERWADLAELFGKRGACGGCWCMWWRLPRSTFTANKGAKNRAALRRLVRTGSMPGLLAYAGSEPVGWCAVAPRDATPGLDRSRILRRVDDLPVWSVTCLFVRKDWRRRGVSFRLIEAAVRFARQCGARAVEGYPVEPRSPDQPDAFVWTGLASAFERSRFEEIARRSSTRPIMRRTLPRRRGQIKRRPSPRSR